MEIITRKEAKERGLKRYFTGKPCKRGGIGQRITGSAKCVCDLCLDFRRPKHRINSAAWRNRNPEKANDRCGARVRAYSQRRKSAKRLAEGEFTRQDINRLIAFQGNKCASCKESLDNSGYHVDHIQPLAKGGTNWPENLQILCPSCNLSKGAKDPYEWANELGRLL